MRELWRKIRWKIAYALAHEWIDDLEHRLSTFLWLQTNGRMSKAYYTIAAMLSEANTGIAMLSGNLARLFSLPVKKLKRHY